MSDLKRAGPRSRSPAGSGTTAARMTTARRFPMRRFTSGFTPFEGRAGEIRRHAADKTGNAEAPRAGEIEGLEDHRDAVDR